MPDNFTDITSQGWLSRIGQAITGVLVGLVLVLVAFPLLWWNEGRAVRTARSLQEGASAVISVPFDRVDAANEGKLVHLSGEATTSETVSDPEFGVSAPSAIKLVRNVEMYQWQEEKKSQERSKLGGGKETTTTYTYSTQWSGRPVDSSSFKHPEGHGNPGSFPFESRTITAGAVTVGGFTLSPDLIAKIDTREARPVGESDANALPAGSNLTMAGGVFYRGENPSVPKVGDLRVKFEIVKPQVVSIVAVQRGNSFEAYQARAGNAILLLQAGTVSADSMFKAAEAENTMLTWLLRAGGFLMMLVGLVLVFRPITVFGSVIPFLGSLLGAGLGAFAFFIATSLSILTIALAWIAYRPLVGIGLLAVAGGAFVLLARMRKKHAPVPAPAK
jgi:hypothetical protein